ncbi:MAG: PAS domain-containing protein, partial [Bacteroidales bacterium]|nr:PAS domain-containing protein [Bacteroidales bacterium]
MFLAALAVICQGLKHSAYADWQSDNPGRAVAIKVIMLLTVLISIAISSVVGFIPEATLSFILTLLLLMTAFGFLIIYHQIVAAVDAREQTEKELKERETMLEQAQRQASIGCWRLTLTTGELLWSQECYRIFGIAVSTPLRYESFLELIHPDERELVNQVWNKALQSGDYDIEHRIVVAGCIRWVREQAVFQRDEHGKVLVILGTVQDITAMKTKES